MGKLRVRVCYRWKQEKYVIFEVKRSPGKEF
jgi:hypothetical protein